MSSGSYLTIYRKFNNEHAANLDKIKAEYLKADSSLFKPEDSKDEDPEEDLPLLMCDAFTAQSCYDTDGKDCNYYDKYGILHKKLLDFHFGSSFTALKEHFHLNPYKFSTSSTFINGDEASKILQAVEYILSRDYSKKVESMLRNEYVDILGKGYSPFDNRFVERTKRVYIDKDGDNYTVSFGDEQWEAEIAEEDEYVELSLRCVKSCIQAFLDAESYSWTHSTDLVLELSAY